tara:strand:+ start:1135 stop:1458 length:324 start_codon:yes stop_codon:yes gene_type:complete
MEEKLKKDYLDNFIKEDFDFDMNTPEGNDKVKEIILEALDKMFYDKDITRKKLVNLIQHRLDTAYSDKSKTYKDIKDTEPKTHIVNQINKASDQLKVGGKISRFDLK